MKNIVNWFNRNRNNLVRNSFLIPILLVVIISISHVVSWYDLGNPLSWAIYLSVAIEIFALASVSAASIKMSRTSIWFLFGLVTLIQIVGNVFFEYQYIDINSEYFQSWVELISPLFIDWDLTDHRRFLAAVQGGTLPLMSLTALHFYIKFNDNIEESKIKEPESKKEDRTNPLSSETVVPVQPMSEHNGIDAVEEINKILREEVDKAKEKYKENVEPIDEEAILNEEDNTEDNEIKVDSNNKLSGNLDKLKQEEDLEREMKPKKNLSERYKNDEGETFGPPNINNI